MKVGGIPYFKIHRDGHGRYCAEKINADGFKWLNEFGLLMEFDSRETFSSLGYCLDACQGYIKDHELSEEGIVYYQPNERR